MAFSTACDRVRPCSPCCYDTVPSAALMHSTRMRLCTTTRHSRPPWRVGRATTRCASHSWTAAARTPAPPSNRLPGTRPFHHIQTLARMLLPVVRCVSRFKALPRQQAKSFALRGYTAAMPKKRRNGGRNKPAGARGHVRARETGRQAALCLLKAAQASRGRPCALACCLGRLGALSRQPRRVAAAGLAAGAGVRAPGRRKPCLTPPRLWRRSSACSASPAAPWCPRTRL